jgi:hypothetical protein
MNIIQHFESRFAKNEKQTGVEAGDFVLKHEGNRMHGVPSMFICNFENCIPLPQNLPFFSQQLRSSS